MASLRIRPWLFFLLLALMAGVIALSTLLSPREGAREEPAWNRSVYSNGVGGYRGWYLACRKARIPVLSVWRKPFQALRDEASSPETRNLSATMLIVQPYTAGRTGFLFGPDETTQLLDWVARGNTVILLDDFRRHGANALARRLHLRVWMYRRPWRKSPDGKQVPLPQALRIAANEPPLRRLIRYAPVSRSETALIPAERLANFAGEGKGDDQSDVLKVALGPPRVLLEDTRHRPMMLRLGYGRGTLILGTVPDLAENAYLRDAANDDNFQFLANLAASTGKPVLINEFIHGYAESQNLLGFFQEKTPLVAIFSQFVLGFCLLLWLGSCRWAPCRQLSRVAMTAGAASHASAMAGLAFRNRAAALALAPRLSRIERALRRRYGGNAREGAVLLPETPANDYSGEARKAEESITRLNEALTAVRKAVVREERLSHRELSRLAHMLHQIEERLKIDGPRSAAP